MKQIKNLKLQLLGLALSAASLPALAATVYSNDSYYTFYQAVDGWTEGAMGAGLATTMLLMGVAIGVVKKSPMTALLGIGGAAFLYWGPQIIKKIMLNGGLF